MIVANEGRGIKMCPFVQPFLDVIGVCCRLVPESPKDARKKDGLVGWSRKRFLHRFVEYRRGP